MQRPLRLGIDLRDLRTAVSGQKTYLEEMVRALETFRGPDLELVFFQYSPDVYTGKVWWKKLLEHGRLHWYKQVTLAYRAWRAGVDVLFTSDYFVPYFRFGFKTVTVFHDAFFFENPEHYSPLFLRFFHRVAVPSARRCARIVVPSEHVRRKLAGLLGVNAEKLVTIYEAPKSLHRRPPNPLFETECLAGWQLASGVYLLHVGMLNKRKNLPCLIRAFAQVLVSFPHLKLVLAGSFDTTPHINGEQEIRQTVSELKLEGRVVFTGYLSDEALAVLYRHASLYVFPSTNEGFGLPVLEAFLHDVPVLVASNSCLPEIGGAAVLGFDPFDHKGLAEKIIGLLSNPETCGQMRLEGRRRLADFSWQKAATQLVGLCRSIQ